MAALNASKKLSIEVAGANPCRASRIVLWLSVKALVLGFSSYLVLIEAAVSPAVIVITIA